MAASALLLSRTEYNDVGLPRKTLDPLGRETEMTYDALLRLTVKRLPTVTIPGGAPGAPATTARYEEHYEYGDNAGSGAFTILCGDAKGRARSSPRTPKDGHGRGRLD
jgi:YD repeat-containing protein